MSKIPSIIGWIVIVGLMVLGALSLWDKVLRDSWNKYFGDNAPQASVAAAQDTDTTAQAQQSVSTVNEPAPVPDQTTEQVIRWADGSKTVEAILTQGIASLRAQAAQFEVMDEAHSVHARLLMEAAENIDDLLNYLRCSGNERPIGTIRARLSTVERNLNLADMHESWQGFVYLSNYVRAQLDNDRNADVLIQIPPQPEE